MQKPSQADIEKSVERNKNRDKLFGVIGLLATFVGMLTLAALLGDLAIDGLARLQPHFFTSFPSRFAGPSGHSLFLGRYHSGHDRHRPVRGPGGHSRRCLSRGICAKELVHGDDRD